MHKGFVRPVIQTNQQMDYNMRIPYVSKKLRTVTLNRRKGVSSFGFAIRGGREHGVGIYVSEVDEGSEAARQGLLVGDQIYRVNGLRIEEAIHSEVLNLILKSRGALTLKVKSVGMLPVKNSDAQPVTNGGESPTSFPSTIPSPDDPFVSPTWPTSPLSNFPVPEPGYISPAYDQKFTPSPTSKFASHSKLSPTSEKSPNSDVLTWKIVDNEWPTSKKKTPSVSSSHSADNPTVRLVLNVSKNQKFGCNICKGPIDRPGIYVQFTTEGGLAREEGLQAGDKILQVNGRDLEGMDFQEAVDYLKSCSKADLVVKKGAASDLFPRESSGYNSSSSSVVGESPLGDFMSSSLSPVKDNPPTDLLAIVADKAPDIKKDVVQTVAVTALATDVLDNGVQGSLSTESVTLHTDSGPSGHSVEKINNMSADQNEDEARQRNVIQKYDQEKKELERRREMEEEKRIQMEYASKLEVQMIDDDIIDNATKNRRRDSMLLQRYYSKEDYAKLQEDSFEDIEEDRETSRSDLQSQRFSSSDSLDYPADEHPVRKMSMEGLDQKENWRKTDSTRFISSDTMSSTSSGQLLDEYQRKQNGHDTDSVRSEGSSYQPTRTSGFVVPSGNNAKPHKFVETPKGSQNKVQMRRPSPVAINQDFEERKSITDSSTAVPKPPDYFFPESKPKITINNYQVNSRPPKRLEYLKHHPSVELESISLPSIPDASPMVPRKAMLSNGTHSPTPFVTTVAVKSSPSNNNKPSNNSNNKPSNNDNNLVKSAPAKDPFTKNVFTTSSSVQGSSNPQQSKGTKPLKMAAPSSFGISTDDRSPSNLQKSTGPSIPKVRTASSSTSVTSMDDRASISSRSSGKEPADFPSNRSNFNAIRSMFDNPQDRVPVAGNSSLPSSPTVRNIESKSAKDSPLKVVANGSGYGINGTRADHRQRGPSAVPMMAFSDTPKIVIKSLK